MSSKDLGQKSIQAVFWVFAAKGGSVLTNFVVTLVLARLLSPDDFGLIAAVIIIFELSMTFVDSGFSAALIREEKISEDDKSTTFIFNLVSSVIIYVLLFFGAPMLSGFFKEPELIPIIRIMGLNVIIGAFAIVHRSVLSQQIDFQTQAKARVLALVVSGGIALVLAYTGFGVWSLVIKFILTALLDTILLWVLVGWQPVRIFSQESFNRLFGFGWKFVFMIFLDKLFRHVFKILIGRLFVSAVLGYYYLAESLRNMVTSSIFQTIHKVTYPVLSKLQNDLIQLKKGYRRILKLCIFVIAPSSVLMILLSSQIITILYGSKWIEASPMLQLLCLAGLTVPFNTINLNMLLVLGRSDLGLKLEFVKKAIIVVALIIGVQHGIYGILVGEVITSYIALFISAYYSKKFLKYSIFEQISDVSRALIYSAIMGLALWGLMHFYIISNIFALAIYGLLGGGIYILLHLSFQTEDMDVIQRTIIPRIKKMLLKYIAPAK